MATFCCGLPGCMRSMRMPRRNGGVFCRSDADRDEVEPDDFSAGEEAPSGVGGKRSAAECSSICALALRCSGWCCCVLSVTGFGRP